MMALHSQSIWQSIEDMVMHRMNFSQPALPQKDEKSSNPLLLFLASGVCALWLIESLMAHIGL